MDLARRAFLAGTAATLAARAGVDADAASVRNVQRVAAPDGTNQLRLSKTGDAYAAQGEWISTPWPLRSGARVRWTPRWVTPQRYRKHSGNPVLGPNTGAWNKWTNGVGILRTADRKRYRMYYCDHRNGIGFAEAPVDQPALWREHPSSPVLHPKGEPHWEGGRINQPRVAKVTDTHWRMYYTGWGHGLWRMGLAESFDEGVTWKRHSDDPLIPLGPPGSPDSESACVPMVIRAGGLWRMWYTASGNRKEGIGIAYATSPDGVHWEKHAGGHVLPVLKDSRWEATVVSRPCVVFGDGVFKMWYSMRGLGTYRIGYAESPDGIHWERSPANPIVDVSPHGWDSDMVEYPEIDIHDGVYRMWFCGNKFGSVGFAEGVADTRLELSVRTGATPAPDRKWSEWSAPLAEPAGSPVGAGRFIQVRARFFTADRRLSPGLTDIELV